MYKNFINYVVRTDSCQSNFIRTLNGVDCMIDMMEKLGLPYKVIVFSDGTKEGSACAKVIETIMNDPNLAAMKYAPGDKEIWKDAINYMKPDTGARFIRKKGAKVTVTSDGWLYFSGTDYDITIRKGAKVW